MATQPRRIDKGTQSVGLGVTFYHATGEFDDTLSGYPWTARLPSASRGGYTRAKVIATHLKMVDLCSAAPAQTRTSAPS